jgi:hypothetical protein
VRRLGCAAAIARFAGDPRDLAGHFGVAGVLEPGCGTSGTRRGAGRGYAVHASCPLAYRGLLRGRLLAVLLRGGGHGCLRTWNPVSAGGVAVEALGVALRLNRMVRHGFIVLGVSPHRYPFGTSRMR